MACYVYVIKSGLTNNAPIKIGVADNPKERLKALQVGNPKQLTLKYTLKCKDRKHAFSMEKLLHRELSGTNLLGEWYRPRRSQLLTTLQKYCEEHDYRVNAEIIIKQDESRMAKLERKVERYKEIIKENESLIREGKIVRGALRDLLNKLGAPKEDVKKFVDERLKNKLDI